MLELLSFFLIKLHGNTTYTTYTAYLKNKWNHLPALSDNGSDFEVSTPIKCITFESYLSYLPHLNFSSTNDSQ